MQQTTLHSAIVGLLNKDILTASYSFGDKKFTFSIREPLPEDKTTCRKFFRVAYKVPVSRYNPKGFTREEIPVYDFVRPEHVEASVRDIIRKALGVKLGVNDLTELSGRR